MSYRIEYNPEKNRKYPIPRTKNRKWVIVALTALVLLFALLKFDGSKTISSWLIPGDPEITVAAFSDMVADIRSGEPAGEAVTAFCLEIIRNG